MATPTRVRASLRLIFTIAALLCVGGSVALGQAVARGVGRIAGDDIAVKGEVSLVRADARSVAALSSGSEVTVRSGQARVTLRDGSEVDVCGPAQFTVLESGGAITIALTSGRIHARLAPDLPVTVFTAQVVATPVSISGRPRDVVLGLEQTGAMCLLPQAGAVRLENQLTGASLLLPQGGEVALADGDLESVRPSEGSCRCEVALVEDFPEEQPRLAQVSTAAPPAERRRDSEPRDPGQPTFTAVMPPLTFDASAPPPRPEPPAGIVLLVQEVRVRPATVFTGRVEDSRTAKPTGQEQAGAKENDGGGFFKKIGGFFRRLFGGKPKG